MINGNVFSKYNLKKKYQSTYLPNVLELFYLILRKKRRKNNDIRERKRIKVKRKISNCEGLGKEKILERKRAEKQMQNRQKESKRFRRKETKLTSRKEDKKK